jgi:hypothetical protein
MTAAALDNPRIYGIQNTLAALVFAMLLLAQCVAYLLYLYPASELLWELSIPLNRIASPILGLFDFSFGHGPFASIAVLAGSLCLPIFGWRARHWLATAVSGHVALALSIIFTISAVRRSWPIESTASLNPFDGIPPVDSNSVCLAAITAALVVLCLIDHAIFFRRIRQA